MDDDVWCVHVYICIGLCWLAAVGLRAAVGLPPPIYIHSLCTKMIFFRSPKRTKCRPFFKFSVLHTPLSKYVYINIACAEKHIFLGHLRGGNAARFSNLAFLKKGQKNTKRSKYQANRFVKHMKTPILLWILKNRKIGKSKNPNFKIQNPKIQNQIMNINMRR